MTETLGRKEGRKELCSLTDSPSRNLSDNDFLFAEAVAPRGVGERRGEERRHRGLLGSKNNNDDNHDNNNKIKSASIFL